MWKCRFYTKSESCGIQTCNCSCKDLYRAITRRVQLNKSGNRFFIFMCTYSISDITYGCNERFSRKDMLYYWRVAICSKIQTIHIVYTHQNIFLLLELIFWTIRNEEKKEKKRRPMKFRVVKAVRIRRKKYEVSWQRYLQE